ncbi:ABC transporter permease [Paenibacillus apiarius]|uniref:ABC transporter permease n=1 Tax=Paenibacillus apiarius TaxID=46240 RepID=A0ABT4DP66_9BACL|nr:ABC transporter permease [Paenibacillus apiarius]MBN3525337.1 ABC transporter permease [Paenibacillus apiarius]MCY9512815.1 ABC transporter permease [Paenibacillus apiarius]MCY9519041.1 ABC transporter permease [Paenibacillus apiarius]MCY9550850.1 ABC transporter permease [Paenibacillus apiarius]MCY9559716.1 ABC transporter permease [Paenibacillus apiarius]
MLQFITRRLLYLIPSLLGIVLITFILSRVLPGDPALMIAGEQAPQHVVENIRAQLGLNDPLYVQFGAYIKQLSQGDLGVAWHTGHTVLEDFAVRLPATIELGFVSLLIALLVAIPVGIVAATKKESIVDHISRIFSLIGACMPVFWLGLLLILFFYSKLGIAPAPMGRIGGDILPPTHITGLYLVDSLLTADWVAFKQSLSHLLLPAICLSAGTMAIIARMMRSSMLEVIGQDYIRTARAKGLNERSVVYKHALVNASIPTVTMIGLQIGYLLGGAVITETIFAWPGVGSYVTESILATDYAPIQAFTLLSAVVYSCINLLVDMVYGLIDPRIRYE